MWKSPSYEMSDSCSRRGAAAKVVSLLCCHDVETTCLAGSEWILFSNDSVEAKVHSHPDDESYNTTSYS